MGFRFSWNCLEPQIHFWEHIRTLKNIEKNAGCSWLGMRLWLFVWSKISKILQSNHVYGCASSSLTEHIWKDISDYALSTFPCICIFYWRANWEDINLKIREIFKTQSTISWTDKQCEKLSLLLFMEENDFINNENKEAVFESKVWTFCASCLHVWKQETIPVSWIEMGQIYLEKSWKSFWDALGSIASLVYEEVPTIHHRYNH